MPRTPTLSKIAWSSLFSLALLGCDSFVYDPPPEPTLVFPEGGTYDAGDPLQLRFSEPIDAASLEINVWQTQLTEDQEIPADAEPVVDGCKLSAGSCGDMTWDEITDDGDLVGLDLRLDPMGLGKPGQPLIVEVRSGLADLVGRDTGVPTYFDVQFRDPDGRFNDEPVEFVDGTYIISSVIQKPLPAVLTLISDVKVMPDGRFFVAGGEGDEINGAPKTTTNPDDLIVDPTDQGWAAHISGFVKLVDGKRLLETDPIDIKLPITPLQVRLEQTRLTAEIIKDEDGNDFIDGTLTFERLVVVNGTREIEQEGGAEAVIGIFVPAERAPENHPLLCGDLCGAIIGLCDIPEGFPDADLCAPPAE